MYKESFYNIEVKDNDELLIFNSISGGLVSLDEKFQKILQDLNSEENDEECVKLLLENGFIVEEEVDELNKFLVAHNIQKYDNNSLSLTIALTLSCNMNCKYCFEDKKNLNFDNNLEEKLIKFIDRNIKYGGNLSICWFGGEPLLQKDVIFRLSDKIKELCQEKKINYQADIVTNGVLLTKEVAKALKSCNVKFAQITIDGLKEIHDRRRTLKNGKSSFDIIIKNISDIQEFFKVELRINIDKENINHIKELVNYLNLQNWSENVNYYFAPIKETEEYEKEKCVSNTEVKKLEINLLGSETHLFKPALTKCSALRYNSFFVNANGDLYKCPNQLNDESNRVATIDDDTILTDKHSEWLINNDIPNKCTRCKILPVCHGGCPKTYSEKNRFKCQYEDINSFKELILLYYKNLSSI